jgi:ribonuclease D
MNIKQWIESYPSWNSAQEKLTTLTAKSDIKLLPKYDLGGRDIVIVTSENLKFSLDDISTYPVLGFDTESRPSFKVGEEHPVCLIQLATPKTCYLFHIKNIKSLSALKPILESKEIKKVGIGLSGDSKSLTKHFGMKLINAIDLVTVFKRIERKNGSGAKHLVATLFAKNLQKSRNISLSNWSKFPLTASQVKYAAEDAMAPLDILQFLCEIVLSYEDKAPVWLIEDITQYTERGLCNS